MDARSKHISTQHYSGLVRQMLVTWVEQQSRLKCKKPFLELSTWRIFYPEPSCLLFFFFPSIYFNNLFEAEDQIKPRLHFHVFKYKLGVFIDLTAFFLCELFYIIHVFLFLFATEHEISAEVDTSQNTPIKLGKILATLKWLLISQYSNLEYWIGEQNMKITFAFC